MKASQDVFITLDRKRAVPAGDKAAQFLLVRAGQDIPQAQAERYAGAVELIGGTKAAPVKEAIETREPSVETRDPETRPAKKK